MPSIGALHFVHIGALLDSSEDGPNYIIPALHREMHYIKNAKFQVIARQHSISYHLARHGLNH